MSVHAHHDAESFSLSEVGVSMQVLNDAGDRVRVVLQVPDDVVRLQHACPADAARAQTAVRRTYRLSRHEFHDLKNHLHAIRLTLHVIHRLEEAGQPDAAAEATRRLVSQVQLLKSLGTRQRDGSELPIPDEVQ